MDLGDSWLRGNVWAEPLQQCHGAAALHYRIPALQALKVSELRPHSSVIAFHR
jgi:hypothetical protein